jgi:putative endonuclease
MYYTYVLISEKDGNQYVGYTKDLKLRFEQHENGQVKVYQKLTPDCNISRHARNF